MANLIARKTQIEQSKYKLTASLVEMAKRIKFSKSEHSRTGMAKQIRRVKKELNVCDFTTDRITKQISEIDLNDLLETQI